MNQHYERISQLLREEKSSSPSEKKDYHKECDIFYHFLFKSVMFVCENKLINFKRGQIFKVQYACNFVFLL